MNNNEIYQELKSKTINQKHLDEYWNIIQFNEYDETVYCENHHILPKHIWHKYKNFSKNKWNLKVLPADKHLLAHWYLANATMDIGMIRAFIMMNTGSKFILSPGDEILYAKLKEEYSNINRDTIWINNGTDRIRLKKDSHIPDGFEFGIGLHPNVLEERNKKIGLANIGRDTWWMDKINKNPEKIKKMADKHRGMKRSPEALENIKQSVRQFNYHTPIGIFDSGKDFQALTGFSDTMLRNRCIVKVDMIVTMASTCKMSDIPNKEDRYKMVGKTWRELGWFTTPVIRDMKS